MHVQIDLCKSAIWFKHNYLLYSLMSHDLYSPVNWTNFDGKDIVVTSNNNQNIKIQRLLFYKAIDTKHQIGGMQNKYIRAICVCPESV